MSPQTKLDQFSIQKVADEVEWMDYNLTKNSDVSWHTIKGNETANIILIALKEWLKINYSNESNL